MALPQNKQAVLKLLDILEPRILGQEQKGFSCGCGAVHCDDAVAVEIIPSGNRYPGQETKWYLWSVNMEAKNGGSGWSCDLSFFIDPKELVSLLKQFFEDADK